MSDLTALSDTCDPRAIPVAVFASSWVSNPDFAMTYSYLRANGTPEDRQALSVPSMGLQIAGEATWLKAPGTMHGAWFSGLRAADRVLSGGDGADKTPVLKPVVQESYDVVIVGAGLAGIAAARLLRSSGCKVVVLEASTTALGRARGFTTPLGDVPLGGMWLHGTKTHPLMPFVHASGIPLVSDVWTVENDDPLSITSPVFTQKGLLDSASRDKEIARFRRLQQHLNATGSDRSLAENLLPPLRSLDTGSRCVQETWFRTLYEGLVAGDLDDLSTTHRYEPFMLDGEDMMLAAPLSQAEPLFLEGLDVRFDTRVTDVVRDRRIWRVSVGKGEGFYAPSVILTMALPPLERLNISPPLPEETLSALSRIGRGAGGKFFAVFKESFWSPLRSFFLAVPGDPLGRVFVDVSEILGRPTLVGFSTFHTSKRLEMLSSTDLRSEVAHLLAPVAYWSSQRNGLRAET